MGVPINRHDNRLSGKEEDEVEEDISVSWSSLTSLLLLFFKQYIIYIFVYICPANEYQHFH